MSKRTLRVVRQHDESTLPKWAQERLEALRFENRWMHDQYRAMQDASNVLAEREWFTLDGPWPDEEARDPLVSRGMFFLSNSGAHEFCRLYPGDKLLIGRAEKRGHGPCVKAKGA